jgi:hypothetical protein
MKGLILALALALSVGCTAVQPVKTTEYFNEEVLITFYLRCGVPVEMVAWGGTVKPFIATVTLNEDGNLLVPTEYVEQMKYLTDHPDLQIVHTETSDPRFTMITCANHKSS